MIPGIVATVFLRPAGSAFLGGGAHRSVGIGSTTSVLVLVWLGGHRAEVAFVVGVRSEVEWERLLVVHDAVRV